MKKIRFGSFPVVSMKKNEQHCLDSYLIKTFADKIAITSALGTISKTERAFITPSLIRKYFKSGQVLENSNLGTFSKDDQLLEEAGGTGPRRGNP